jgi:hypothetical protein
MAGLAPQLGIDVGQHTVGGLSLAGMTCDRAAMIEARMRRRIKLDYWLLGCAGVLSVILHEVLPGAGASRSVWNSN